MNAEVGVQAARWRILPWMRDLYVPRFGRNLAEPVVQDLVQRLTATASSPAVLRLRVGVWDEREGRRAALTRHMAAAGFERASGTRSYARTVWIDLGPEEDEIMAGFHASCRRSIRAPGKKGFRVGPILRKSAIPTLEAIFAETFARTGGSPPYVDWGEVLRLNRDPGGPLHMVGLFHEDSADSDPPIAFAMAVLHGDVAEYSQAGSIRDRSIRIPMLYAPTWELMRWARRRGARWWDFGGITSGTAESEDPRGGISDFKRYFSENVVKVGEEWLLEPKNLGSRLGRRIHALLHHVD